MTGTRPYHDLKDDVVEAKFKQGDFPSVDSIPCGQFILRCWESTIDRANDVHKALQAAIAVLCFDL